MMLFAKVESYKKGFVSSSMLNVLARLFAFVNSLLVAYFFGTSRQVDIYFFVLSTAFLVSGLLIGFVPSILVPEAMHIREQRNERDAMEFLNFFVYACVAVSLVVLAVLIVWPVRMYAMFSKFDMTTLSAHAPMLLVSALLIPLMALSVILSEVLTSYKFFSYPVIVGLFNSGFSIVFMVAFHNSLGIGAALYGLITGYLLNVALLAITLRTRLGWTVRASVRCVNRKIFTNIALSQAGNLATFFGGYVPLFILSGFSAGTITALTFGRQLADLSHQFITRQFSAVSGIKFNELHARHDLQAMDSAFRETAKMLIFLMVPVTALLWLFSDEIVAIVYKRGVFDESSVRQSAVFLSFFALPLVLTGLDSIVSRVYMATKKIDISFINQIGFNLLNIVLMIALVRVVGALALPVALLIAYIVNAVVQRYLLRWVAPFLSIDAVLRHLALLIGVNACIAGLIWFVTTRFAVSVPALVLVSCGFAVYAVVLAVLTMTFGINPQIRALCLKAVTTFR